MVNSLEKGHCVPCEGGAKPLTTDQVKEYSGALSNWTVQGGKSIEKKYQFADFAQALSFINGVGDIAESEGHHPDIHLYNWNQVTLTLSTHAIGGLSTNDFILAAKIDALRNEKFSNK